MGGILDDLVDALTETQKQPPQPPPRIDLSKMEVETISPEDSISADITKGLEQLSQQMAEDSAKQDERYREERIHAAKDKKKKFAHELLIAAFSSVLTLLIEHFADIIDFIKDLFR